MTVSEIFNAISNHQIEGIMLHGQMADYFDFLSLHGFKRMQEYHYLDESTCMRSVHRYYINHYGKLLPGGHPAGPSLIPASWGNYTRQEVDASTKRRAIRDAFIKWRDWEVETKKLYEKSYTDLYNLGEVAAACKVKELVMDVDKELKCVERLHIKLESIEYDMSAIYLMQDELHEKYRKKAKSVGVDIC
ncbi:hypothetical protein [Ruthenibacterium lactatiformans]|uniref:hypothetical protein n=1 Tax=Ruthenibacterium lactatiformans TaxID=1550024 RepID=UPI0022DFE98D|nr:hypothetical protein [Ruthenibacterium lactatiformans]